MHHPARPSCRGRRSSSSRTSGSFVRVALGEGAPSRANETPPVRLSPAPNQDFFTPPRRMESGDPGPWRGLGPLYLGKCLGPFGLSVNKETPSPSTPPGPGSRHPTGGTGEGPVSIPWTSGWTSRCSDCPGSSRLSHPSSSGGVHPGPDGTDGSVGTRSRWPPRGAVQAGARAVSLGLRRGSLGVAPLRDAHVGDGRCQTSGAARRRRAGVSVSTHHSPVRVLTLPCLSSSVVVEDGPGVHSSVRSHTTRHSGSGSGRGSSGCTRSCGPSSGCRRSRRRSPGRGRGCG